MSCEITQGRAEVCKDSFGGLKAIFFINFQIEKSYVTYDATNTDVITEVTNVDTLYKYELRGENVFDQDIATDRNAGTTIVTQKLAIKLKKKDVATTKIVKLLAYGRPHIVVQDMNDNFFLMGLENGCELTGGNLTSGTSGKDFNGYSLTFQAEEKVPANHLDASTQSAMVTLFTGATLETS